MNLSAVTVTWPQLGEVKLSAMKVKICLWFNGNAREAAEYYVKTFPDARLSDNWVAPTTTPGNEVGTEVVVNFEMFGQEFIALNGGPQFKFSEAFSIQLPCANQAEIDHYWNTLIADGGQASQCGWLKDRFGFSWQITSPEMTRYIAGPDLVGAKRATEAMLEMTKIELAALKFAYENA